MATTRYFLEQVQRKRPYVTEELSRRIIAAPLRRQVQADGRIRYYGQVTLPHEEQSRILRVVTLEDGTTLHNAFVDRGESIE